MDSKQTIKAYRDTISTSVQLSHDWDNAHVAELVEALESGATLPPILVVEDLGNGCLVLDGHHRILAAKQTGLTTIDAWVVDSAELDQIIASEFGGEWPDSRLADLDDYITIDGASYNGRA